MTQMGWLARQDGYDPNAFDVPLEQTYDRRFDQTWPGRLAQDVMGAVLAPGRAVRSTEPITTEEMIKPAADLAGLVTGGSYAAPAQRGASGAGIRAYHSSPHDFDKFDLAKIGTGEGAQMYGHGLYFAENPAVSGQGGQYWNQFSKRFTGDERTASTYLQAGKFDREQAAENLYRSIYDTKQAITNGKHSNGQVMSPEYITDQIEYMNQQRRALKLLESGKPVGPRTYEVDIAADPAQMLDWDKALSQQPHIEDVLRQSGFKDARWPYSGMEGSHSMVQPITSGQDVYRSLGIERAGSRNTPTQVARRYATEALREAGIPGIKYLDQGSRMPGPSAMTTQQLQTRLNSMRDDLASGRGNQSWLEGQIKSIENELERFHQKPTSNYVIFDPNLIRIDKKYVIPGAVAGMGALAAQDQYEGVR